VDYLWSNGAITSTIEVSTSGTYTVQVMDNDRCSAESESISVEVFENPVVSIAADGSTSLCTGSTVTLTSDFANGNIWSTGATSHSILVDETGTYSVEYTDNNGCSSISNLINVSVSDAPTPTISTSGSTSICDGSALSLLSSSGESYVWYLNGIMLENADTQSLEVTEQVME
jgi:large repetitive protein